MLRSPLSLVGLTLLLASLAACSSPVSPTDPGIGPSGQGKPAKPSNFRITKDPNGFLLQWDAVSGASGYQLLRTGGGPVNPTNPSYLERNANVGDKVEYTVWAKSGSVLSDGLTVTATMPSSGTSTPPQPAPLAKPANLRVSSASNGFLIQWDAVSGATGYKFQRTGGGPVNTGQPSYTETNAKAGDKIEYSVWATNSSSTSAALTASLTMPAASTPAPTPGGLVATSYQTSSAVFPNPERGRHDNGDFPFPASWNLDDPNLLNWIRSNYSDVSMIRGIVRLDSFRSGPISDSFLGRFDKSFDVARRFGFKMILRFVYNYDGGGADASLSTIRQHISQLQPILQRNKDLIVSLQAGFIGAWGEWHSSSNGLATPSNKRAVLDALLAALPSDRMVQVRYPGDLITFYSSALGSSQAFSGSSQARVGNHNDCFLGADKDGGSWDPISGWTEAGMRSYMNQSSQYTVQGGETCADVLTISNPRGDCSVALKEFQTFNWDILNLVYYDGKGGYPSGDNPRWVSGGCMETIKRNLGYRFQLTQSQMSGQVKPGGQFYLTFTVNNVGWGKLFNPRNLEVILRNKASGKVYRLTASADPRTWISGSTNTVTVNGGVPSSAPTGDYDVLLNLPDPSGRLYGDPNFSIRLANANVWESGTGFNSLLKTLNINTSASGSSYTGSKWFQ